MHLAHEPRPVVRAAGCEPPRSGPADCPQPSAGLPAAGWQLSPSNANGSVAPTRRTRSERCRRTAPGSHSLSLTSPLTISEGAFTCHP